MEPTTHLAWLALAALACPLAVATREKGATMGGAAGGWRKHEGSPVLGGKLGTCFDVSVLREGDRFRMWFSWRPKASLALAESADGLAWGEPKIVLGPNPDTPWEKDLKRPSVLKRGGRHGDTYHMANIPWFECPDKELEETYYFRWWTYRKHIKQTADGFVVTGLVGLRPRDDDTVEVNPLVPAEAWDYFCLDGVPYRGRTVTIVWDKTGARYGKGSGLRVLCDGKEVARAPGIQRLTRALP